MHSMFLSVHCQAPRAGREPGERKMSPSFFKIMLGDFPIRLRVPPAFVKNFGVTLPDRVHLTSCYVGRSSATWRVNMEKSEKGCYITEGWPQIVKDLDLQMGDFLVFELLSKGALGVVAYDRTCCEKRISISNFEERKEVAGPAPAGASSSAKKRRPFFVKSLSKTDMRYLTLPTAAAMEADQWNKKSAVVRGLKGQKWLVAMKLRVRTRSYRRVDLSTGWRTFIQDTGLSPEDTVRFEFLGGRDNVIEARVLSRASKEKTRPSQRR